MSKKAIIWLVVGLALTAAAVGVYVYMKRKDKPDTGSNARDTGLTVPIVPVTHRVNPDGGTGTYTKNRGSQTPPTK